MNARRLAAKVEIQVAAVIDVLAFPPTATALARARERALARVERMVRLGRWSRFVSVGMFLSWIADVTAALAPPAHDTALLFGVGSLLLSVCVISAHLFANRTLGKALRLRRSIDRDFGVVRLGDAQPLLASARDDVVVAQYLRMVGRQQRPLTGIELAALTGWSIRDLPRER